MPGVKVKVTHCVCVFLDHGRIIQEIEAEQAVVEDELKKLEKEVICIKAERDTAIQQQASSNIKLKELEKENIDIRQERDIVKEQLSKLTAASDCKVEQQQIDHKLTVSQPETEQNQVTDGVTNQNTDYKLLEKEKDEARKERDEIKDQLSKFTAESDVIVKQLLLEKLELVEKLIEANEKLSKLFEEKLDAIKNTKHGLTYFTAPEKGKCKLFQVGFTFGNMRKNFVS